MTVQDFRDLVRLLEERPEWRAELRRLLLTEELLTLPQIVRELAVTVQHLVEAQARTEARLAELAQAQARTDARADRIEATVERLVEAQARTEARLDRIEATVERLVEAQARTEARLAELAQAQAQTAAQLAELVAVQARMGTRLGHLANLLGADLEVDAQDVLRQALREKGYALGEAVTFEFDGDLDVGLPATDPTGRRVWVVVGVKTRVRTPDVVSWAQRVRDPAFRARLEARGVPGPYLAYVFGLRVYEEAVAAARERGVGVLVPQGERLAPELL